MSYKYCCNHCDYSSATQHYINHLVSTHKDDLFNDKTKHTILGALKGKTLPVLSVKLKGDNSKHNIHVCFGCNKFWQRGNLVVKHLQECTNKTKHLDFLKSLVDANANANANANDNANTVISVNTDEVDALKAKILKLEKKIVILEKEAKVYEEDADAFHKVFSFFTEHKSDDFRITLFEDLTKKYKDIHWEQYIDTPQ